MLEAGMLMFQEMLSDFQTNLTGPVLTQSRKDSPSGQLSGPASKAASYKPTGPVCL